MEQKLFVRRKEKGLLQKDVANLIGMHPQSYHLKESGKREFTISEAIKLAEIFDCSLDGLFRKEVK